MATSNSSTRGQPKLLHPWLRDGEDGSLLQQRRPADDRGRGNRGRGEHDGSGPPRLVFLEMIRYATGNLLLAEVEALVNTIVLAGAGAVAAAGGGGLKVVRGEFESPTDGLRVFRRTDLVLRSHLVISVQCPARQIADHSPFRLPPAKRRCSILAPPHCVPDRGPT